MDFSLTEEQTLLRDSVEKYVAENCSVERHRALTNTDPGFDESSWRQFAELGWLAVPFAEELGGFEGGAVETMVVAEAMGKGIVREPYLHTVIVCGGLLSRAGSTEQQAAHIPAIIDGSTQWAFAFAERGSDYDLANVETSALQAGDGFTLCGRKIAVLNGHCAQQIIVTAASSEGVGLFVVDAKAQGLTLNAFTAVDGSKGAELVLEEVAVGADQVLAQPGEALPVIEQVLNLAVIAMGGEAVGSMQSLLDTTVEYTKTRKQFGQPISNFQALQHRMADMYIKVEEARALLLNAAIQIDEGNAGASAACAALKVKIADAGRYVSQQAVQLHGGIGMTDELSVGHHYKRLLLLSKFLGDEEFHLNRYIALSNADAA